MKNKDSKFSIISALILVFILTQMNTSNQLGEDFMRYINKINSTPGKPVRTIPFVLEVEKSVIEFTNGVEKESFTLSDVLNTKDIQKLFQITSHSGIYFTLSENDIGEEVIRLIAPVLEKELDVEIETFDIPKHVFPEELYKIIETTSESGIQIHVDMHPTGIYFQYFNQSSSSFEILRLDPLDFSLQKLIDVNQVMQDQLKTDGAQYKVRQMFVMGNGTIGLVTNLRNDWPDYFLAFGLDGSIEALELSQGRRLENVHHIEGTNIVLFTVDTDNSIYANIGDTQEGQNPRVLYYYNYDKGFGEVIDVFNIIEHGNYNYSVFSSGSNVIISAESRLRRDIHPFPENFIGDTRALQSFFKISEKGSLELVGSVILNPLNAEFGTFKFINALSEKLEPVIQSITPVEIGDNEYKNVPTAEIAEINNDNFLEIMYQTYPQETIIEIIPAQ